MITFDELERVRVLGTAPRQQFSAGAAAQSSQRIWTALETTHEMISGDHTFQSDAIHSASTSHVSSHVDILAQQRATKHLSRGRWEGSRDFSPAVRHSAIC